MAEQQNKTVLTEEGLKKLEAQLDYLVSVRRNEVSEQIAIARGFGDLSENAEYDEAKKEQAKVEEEIVRLTNTIRTAVVVADSEISTEKVSVGTSVRVKDVDTGDEDVYATIEDEAEFNAVFDKCMAAVEEEDEAAALEMETVDLDGEDEE